MWNVERKGNYHSYIIVVYLGKNYNKVKKKKKKQNPSKLVFFFKFRPYAISTIYYFDH